MTEPVAQLDAVWASYSATDGGRRVLEGANLSIASGEMVALLGPNGSGKTTLLRVLAGTLGVSRGTASLFGRPIGEWSRTEIARRVAVLPQATELPAGFSVSEIVALGRIPHGRSWFGPDPGDAGAVAAALRDADAETLAARPASELSGGERQRVLVAMALAQEPRLLLLDEPTLHLDLAHQVALVRTLARLRSTRPLTVLAVLHDLNLAAAFDRSVILHRGRLAPAGRAGQPLDPALARRVFGIPIEEAVTSTGRRVLALAAPAPHEVE